MKSLHLPLLFLHSAVDIERLDLLQGVIDDFGWLRVVHTLLLAQIKVESADRTAL